MKTFFKIFLILILITGKLFSQTQINYGENTKVGQFIKVNDINMYYEVYGNGSPILLIHGNKTGIKGWKTQIEYFSKKYKVYSIDCRGRGKSEFGLDTLSYNKIASDISEFIKITKLDSVVIVGKSDGGIISLIMGIKYPEHIKKIVTFGANIKCDSTALFQTTINEIKKERMFADEMIKKNDTTKNWKIEQQRNRMMEFQPNIEFSELKKIKIPVLVMSCDRDVVKEEHTLSIYKNIKYANLCIFPGMVHRFPTINPELFNQTVDNFISNPFVNELERFK
jgi:pimeloyl-ACP methyl ester carboxylesterase